ncbi:DUF2336 domain-containing protein [Arvimicrobium flavum]|uniref:DUF2336 domain-containing protein n=1 Tax=Arvimicrobium flavum TaxID=3393320 RepID=UPI00237AF3CD|nr:DUF2336 domain-containing protein [Mesorhizobium shangrilense]
MVIEHLLKWMRTARVAERVAAASALARTFNDRDLSFEDRCAAEAALTLLLDDPSPKVRAAIADALSMSRRAPLQIVSALAADQPDVAAMIIGRSPLLTDADLVERVCSGDPAIQLLVARRPLVSLQVSAAIAEVAEVCACVALVGNSGGKVAAISFRRMIERHGDNADLRDAILKRPDLPSDCRHMLLVRVGEAFKTSPLLLKLVGPQRAERITREACAKASLTLIDGARPDELGALVEHLRLSGELSASFVIRAIAHGKIDFFGAVMIALSGQTESRVRTLLARGNDVAVSALMRAAGLAEGIHRVILTALKIWREVANGKRVAGAQEVSWTMLKEVGGQGAEGELAGLLKSIHIEALRDNARGHALAIAAA